MEIKEEKEMDTLPPREQGSHVLGFVKKLSWRGFACLCTYMLGYWNWSIAWMVTPLILSALRDQYKKERRQRLAAAREAALTNEQAMIESRMLVDDLPSWVYFPDKERAEWVNNIIKQLWPNVNNYVRKTLFETVEPLVTNILNGYGIKGFKFERERVYLGHVPPRITGVKVYNEKETSRNEIILDIDIVFASDLEVEFSVKRIKARVSEFSLRGMLRVVLKPLISDIPLIGGVQVFFLSDPEIDYSLGGVAGALDVPGLDNIVRNIVIEQIRNFIVLPNKFYLSLSSSIPKKDLICPNTAGVLRVTLIQAKDLMQKDVGIVGKGSSDPYAILTVGATTYKTPTITNNCNPSWNRTYDFPIEVVHGQDFTMEFFDEDDRRDDEFLGRAKVQTAAVAERGEIQGFWVDLEECESGKAQLSLSWLPVTSNQTHVREMSKGGGEDENAKCILHIFVDNCTGLNNVKNPGYKPSPLVQITCGKDVRQTWPKSFTSNPVIEQGFVMLVNNPHADVIHIKVLDTSKQNNCVGTMSVNVWNIVQQPDMEYPLQPWILKGSSSDAQITMSVSVRGLMKQSSSPKKTTDATPLIDGPGIEQSSSIQVKTALYDETVKAGTIKLQLFQGSNLEKKDVNGKSDPYAIISYEDQESKTKTCKNTVEPEWYHEEVINIKENGDNQIHIRVFDKDKIGKDEPLGLTTLDVRRVSYAGAILQEWTDLSHCKSGKILLSAEFTPKQSFKKEEVETVDPVQKKEIGDHLKHEDLLIKLDEPAVDVTDPAQGSPSEPSSPTPQSSANDTLGYMVEEENDMTGNENTEFTEPPAEPQPDQESGFLNATIHRAIDLEKKDFAGKSDPYVVLRFNNQKMKSKVFKNNLNPEFNFQEQFVYKVGDSTLMKIELYDDDVGKDEFLGSVDIDLSGVVAGQDIINHWKDLEGVKRGKICFSVEFSLYEKIEQIRRPSHNNIIAAAISPIISIASPQASIGELGEGDDGLRRRVVGTNGKIRLTIIYDDLKSELKLFVHEATGLPGGDLPDPPDPYVKIYLMPGKRKKKKTSVVKDTGNPRFDEEFDFDVSFNNLQEHSLKICVVDKKGTFSKGSILGVTMVSLDNPGLLQGVADWFPLHHDDQDSE